MSTLLYPEQLQTRTEFLQWKVYTIGIKILKHLLREVWQEVRHGCNSMVQKTKYSQCDTCQGTELVQSQHKPVLERTICGGCSSYSTCSLPAATNSSSICLPQKSKQCVLAQKCLGKASPGSHSPSQPRSRSYLSSNKGKLVRVNWSPSGFSPTALIWFPNLGKTKSLQCTHFSSANNTEETAETLVKSRTITGFFVVVVVLLFLQGEKTPGIVLNKGPWNSTQCRTTRQVLKSPCGSLRPSEDIDMEQITEQKPCDSSPDSRIQALCSRRMYSNLTQLRN